MVRTLASIALFCCSLFTATPAWAIAPLPKKEFTEREKERILLPCKRASPDRRIRCEVRELKRAEAEWGKSNPTDAYAVYDWMDLGGQHLRDRLQQERVDAFTEHWEQTRKVYSQFTPTDDVNTQRLPYVNAIRESRLDCMYVQHGRARAKCFDIQIDVSQRMMRTPQK
ncbi:MAG: hypothetical protein PHO20_01315 [Candidatus Peribacteraceae bacterium]|nr:hypothetical protein [Candidatus Peribacteraceae bacterium]MDD5739387.1 hypothetical protein [Candidatus Peribacteraceae bacterium]